MIQMQCNGATVHSSAMRRGEDESMKEVEQEKVSFTSIDGQRLFGVCIYIKRESMCMVPKAKRKNRKCSWM